jgi:hypothetical protein
MNVYIIHRKTTETPIKIGISGDVKSRLAGLQTASPEELIIRYILTCKNQESAYKVERLLHKKYADRRLSGEWFDINPQVVINDIELAMAVADNITSGREVVYREKIVYRDAPTKQSVLRSFYISLIQLGIFTTFHAVEGSTPAGILGRLIDFIEQNPMWANAPVFGPKELAFVSQCGLFDELMEAEIIKPKK